MEQYYFYIDQVIFVLLTFFSAREEKYGTWAFRMFAPANTIESKLYHSWGIKTIILMGIVSGFGFSTGVISFVLLCFLNAFIYWLLFDIWYAKSVGNDWYYMGNEAGTDRKVKKYFGKDPGKKKAYLCILVVVLLNGLYILIN